MKTTAVSLTPAPPGPNRAPEPKAPASGFDTALQGARFTLSRHAAARLSRRGLLMDAGRASRLADGIDKAASRGSDTSLVLMDELALLVKVPQRLVMTAMSQKAMREGVVTRIDSAVVV